MELAGLVEPQGPLGFQQAGFNSRVSTKTFTGHFERVLERTGITESFHCRPRTSIVRLGTGDQQRHTK